MDFHQLLARMNELDQPAPAADAVVEEPVATDECGEMPPSPMGMSMPKEQDAPPPSMSLNLNAQGLDNIEELMKLIKAVNPDLDKSASAEMPPMMSIEPMDKSMGGLPPLKMLPDMDADNDHKIGGEEDGEEGGEEPEDMDGEKEKEEEAFGNSLGDSEPEVKDVDAAIPDGNDLNKPKTMVKHSYKQGDNPMAMEGEDLRSWIRSELQKKLAEAKGAK